MSIINITGSSTSRCHDDDDNGHGNNGSCDDGNDNAVLSIINITNSTSSCHGDDDGSSGNVEW